MKPMPPTVRIDDRIGECVLTRTCGYCREVFNPTREHQRYCRPGRRIAAFKAKEAGAPRRGDPVLFDL